MFSYESTPKGYLNRISNTPANQSEFLLTKNSRSLSNFQQLLFFVLLLTLSSLFLSKTVLKVYGPLSTHTGNAWRPVSKFHQIYPITSRYRMLFHFHYFSFSSTFSHKECIKSRVNPLHSWKIPVSPSLLNQPSTMLFLNSTLLPCPLHLCSIYLHSDKKKGAWLLAVKRCYCCEGGGGGVRRRVSRTTRGQWRHRNEEACEACEHCAGSCIGGSSWSIECMKE